MIFGSKDLPISLDKSTISNRYTKYGANEATYSFYEALIKYGTFDKYHFFVDPIIKSSNNKRLLLSHLVNSDKVELKETVEIPSCLRKIKYTVFFGSVAGLSDLAYLRNRFAKEYFPLCGLTHSLSYQSVLKEYLFNMISDLHPFDSIVCTSSTALKAMKNLYRIVSTAFSEETGLVLKYKGRLDQLPLGIDADSYAKVDKFEARKRLGLAKNKIILLYFGRFSLSDKMDLQPLLISFKRLLAKHKEIVLVLAGSDAQGGYSTKLRKLTRDMHILSDVRFYIDPPLREKYLLYSASDIFVSPSDNIQETFGLTVLEAMASGLPVVASDWNGYRDLIVHNETGFLVPTYWGECDKKITSLSRLTPNFHQDHLGLAQSVCVDIEALTERLSMLIKQRDLRVHYGQNGRNRVLEQYDWRVVIPAYEALWKTLSKLAQNYPVKRKRSRMFIPQYFKCFHHYASKTIKSTTKILISKDGIQTLKTKKLPPLPIQIKHLISTKIVFLVLIFLFKKKSSTVGEIQQYAKRVLNIASTSEIRYNILWLFKKGLIRTM